MSGAPRHDPRLVNLVAGFLTREFGEDGFLPLSTRDGAAVRLLDLLADAAPPVGFLAASDDLPPERLDALKAAWDQARRGYLEAQADKPGGLVEQKPGGEAP